MNKKVFGVGDKKKEKKTPELNTALRRPVVANEMHLSPMYILVQQVGAYLSDKQVGAEKNNAQTDLSHARKHALTRSHTRKTKQKKRTWQKKMSADSLGWSPAV
jgi:hypothetical protein